jgi:osmotically inducible lipoprotein OsmB
LAIDVSIETFGGALMDTRLRMISLAMAAAAFSVFTVGCGSPELTPRESMTLAGGVIGAGTGALVGSATGPGAAIGAGIGGGIGLVGGAAVGDQIEIIEARNEQTESQLERQEKDLEVQRREMDQMKLQQERDELQNQSQSRIR